MSYRDDGRRARPADDDNPSWRQRQRRREEDLAFIAKLRSATLAQLSVMLTFHRHKSAPEWKVVAIKRAMKARLSI